MTEIWVHHLAYPVTALGPGERLALWVSGCSLQCPGCITPHLWARDAGTRKGTSAVASRLLAIDRPLDGLTITGGEPFEQAAALAALIDAVRPGRPHWSVIVYSGYRLAALRRMGADPAALLARTDVLIDGAFRQDRPSRHPLTGSGNQCVHYLSARGARLRAAIAGLPRNQANLGLAESQDDDWLIGVIDPERRASINQAIGSGDPSHPRDKPIPRPQPPGAA